MPSESADRRAPPAPAPEQEQLACPRCDSTNTKFCYYNNYNFSQPRHFCKSCRRYWTRGGTLRDIPVGGGTRKNAAKRSRILPPGNPSAAAAATTPAVATATATSSPPGEPLPGNHYFSGGGGAGSFTSLLNASGGLLGLGGLGLGIGPGFEESGFGPLGRPMWAFPEFGYMGGANGAVMSTMGNAGATGGGMMMHTWQMEGGGDQAQAGGGGGFVGGECFSWPELAISTPGNGLK